MAACVSDEVVDEVAVSGANPLELSKLAFSRYAGLVDRVNIHAGEHSSPERLEQLAAGFGEALASHASS